MKYILAAFVAFATIFCVSALDPVPDNLGPTKNGVIQLGNALNVTIKELVMEVINFVAINALKTVPALKVIILAELATALTALGTEVTIANLLLGIFKFLKVNGAAVVAPLPKIVAKQKVTISKLLEFIKSKLAPDTKEVLFGIVLTLTGDFLLDLLVTFFVTFLNNLSNN